MKNRLIKAMMGVLFIQVLLFVIAIFAGNTIRNLSQEYLKILENKVSIRKNYIQDEMLQRWSNIIDFEEYVQEEVKKISEEKNSESIDMLLENIAEQTVAQLRQTGVTEIFVIIEGEKEQEGIYLRDLDPLFNTSDNSDILMERGSVDIAQKMDLALDSKWSYKFDLSQEDKASEFYYKPFLAAKSYPNMEIQDLGYWSRPFRLSENDVEIITYSMPLLDEKGQVFGVIGVGLTVDYLSDKLKYDELVDNKRGFYLLNINNKIEGTNEKIASNGPLYNIFEESETSSYEKINDKNIYMLKGNQNIKGDIYASDHKFTLYNENTPFENDEWSLIGFVEKKHLLKPIDDIIHIIIISLLVSLLLGLVAVYIIGGLFMKPINKLMAEVIQSNPDKPFKLNKTNILEIDKLGFAIERLNNKVIDSASKLSQIIDMVNIPIGAFEYTEDEEDAFCTNTLFEILGLENNKSINKVKTSYLKEIIKKIMIKPEADIPDVYKFKRLDEETCWVQLIIREQEGKVLGVIEDVTDAIISKRKIEYERDHDVLTHLLNRRAFEFVVKKKMREDNLDKSAFVMWDLDNLKYINDTYGHKYGDRYIQRAASVLSSFIEHNIIVARMSGDEFYTFIYGYKKKSDIRNIINEIKDSLYNSFLEVPDKSVIRIRASGGVAWYPDNSNNYENLIKYSDFAMYEVKNKDKGNVSEFNIDSYNKDSILLHGKEELNYFIDNALVRYDFQPIIDAKTSEIFAYEALMRPQTKKLKSPYDVIRLAQSQSKLYEIEKLTFFQSLKAYERQRDKFKDAKIFVNSIADHVLSDKDLNIFEERFADHLKNIIIEITENEQSNDETTRKKQLRVNSWGTYLALDDFGSGYNGELALLVLSPKYIKIDMNIIRGIDKDLNRQKLLKNILSYSKNRNIKIIAEGVETREEIDKLIEFNVDYMQGYYIGKPNSIPQDVNPKVKLEIKSIHKKYLK